MDEKSLEERIRRRAYQLWLDAGKPEGLADTHWDQASELIAIEDGQRATLVPVSDHESEPIEAVQNQGEFPTLTDQGEQQWPAEAAAAGRQNDDKR
jgi:hypothetical protein